MRHCMMVHPPKPDLDELVLVFLSKSLCFKNSPLVVSIAFDLPLRFDYSLNAQKNVVEYCYRQSNQHSEYNPAKHYTSKLELKILNSLLRQKNIHLK